MSHRKIAILIDGGFFLKRLPEVVKPKFCNTPEAVASSLRLLCRNHVRDLTGTKDGWLEYVYRTFFYDAKPYDKQAHHPITNQQINFANSDQAKFRNELFELLRRHRKTALRLGKVNRESDWSPPSTKVRKVLKTRDWINSIDFDSAPLSLSQEQIDEAKRLQNHWSNIEDHDVALGLRQKGVDMRIGIDIASIALKKQANTIILVSGDSDFVPAAKLARREGVDFILDPMWQQVNEDLFEHIDGLQSGLKITNKP